MKTFFLAETPKTPEINCNPEQGTFLISGRSIPENSIEFYKPLFDWLDNYAESPNSKTVMDVKMEYFNTSSSKCLVEVFRRLELVHSKGYDVSINWYFEEDDEDMEESGEDFQEIIRIPIEMIMLEEE